MANSHAFGVPSPGGRRALRPPPQPNGLHLLLRSHVRGTAGARLRRAGLPRGGAIWFRDGPLRPRCGSSKLQSALGLEQGTDAETPGGFSERLGGPAQEGVALSGSVWSLPAPPHPALLFVFAKTNEGYARLCALVTRRSLEPERFDRAGRPRRRGGGHVALVAPTDAALCPQESGAEAGEPLRAPLGRAQGRRRRARRRGLAEAAPPRRPRGLLRGALGLRRPPRPARRQTPAPRGRAEGVPLAREEAGQRSRGTRAPSKRRASWRPPAT